MLGHRANLVRGVSHIESGFAVRIPRLPNAIVHVGSAIVQCIEVSQLHKVMTLKFRQLGRRPGRLALAGTKPLMLRLRAVLARRGAHGWSLGLLVAVGVLGWLQVASNLLLVVVLLSVTLYEFEKRIDQGLPLMQIAALLGVLQWLVGPALSFKTDLVQGRYAMYVAEDAYFGFALPGTAAYVFGLLWAGFSMRQRNLLRQVPRSGFVQVGLALVAVSVVAEILGGFLPGAFAFLFLLLSQLRYVAVLYFLFSGSPYRWLLIAPIPLILLKQTAESAMFHDMLLWAGMLFCYWFALRPRNPLFKGVVLSFAAALAFTIQGIKPDYRAEVWQGEEASLVEAVFSFWSDDRRVLDESMFANVITRLNQGWIISAVIAQVPETEPHANGETLADAFVAAFLPRILAPNKVEAGGQENFRRFTGLRLGEGTSMSISPLGEAYANFGRGGGVVTMLAFGAALSLSYALCIRWAVRYPDFLFWIPLIFYQAIKAETEFATVLNQITKGAVVAFGLHWVLRVIVLPMILPEDRLDGQRARRRDRRRTVAKRVRVQNPCD